MLLLGARFVNFPVNRMHCRMDNFQALFERWNASENMQKSSHDY